MHKNNDRVVLKELLELYDSLCDDDVLAKKLSRPERGTVESLLKATRLLILFYSKRLDNQIETKTH